MKIIKKGDVPLRNCASTEGKYECLDCGSIIYFEDEDDKICPICKSRELMYRYEENFTRDQIKDTLINNIIENFEFSKVQSVMEYLNWAWAYSNGEVPTIQKIKEVAKSLLEEAWDRKTIISTGGLTAKYTVDEEDTEYGKLENLSLSFNIDAWDACWSHKKNSIEYF